jgi:hypothetical protein
MSDDGVGYGKPPKRSRFKPGVSGNPKGRPKRRPVELAGLIESVLSAPITFKEGGRSKTTTRYELSLKKLIEHAVNTIYVEDNAVRLPKSEPGQAAGDEPEVLPVACA